MKIFFIFIFNPSVSLHFCLSLFPHKEFENDVPKMKMLVLYSTEISVFGNRRSVTGQS